MVAHFRRLAMEIPSPPPPELADRKAAWAKRAVNEILAQLPPAHTPFGGHVHIKLRVGSAGERRDLPALTTQTSSAPDAPRHR